MKTCIAALIIVCAAFAGFTQETGAGNIIAFDLNIAPNTDGALEGEAELGILYSPWVYSGAVFSVTNFTTVYEENNGSTTSVESVKNLDIDIVRTRPEFLKWNFSGDEYYAGVNARLLLNLKWMNRERYGYGDYFSAFSMFYAEEDVFNLYPFAGGDLEIGLGPLTLSGYYLRSIMVLSTAIEGEYFYSALPITEPEPYSLEDRGFETRIGGSAVFTPIPELTVQYNFDYINHKGYTYGFSGGSVSEVVYEGIEMKHVATLSLDIGEYTPVIGASYTTYSFDPLDLYAVEPYTNARWGFIFGVKY